MNRKHSGSMRPPNPVPPLTGNHIPGPTYDIPPPPPPSNDNPQVVALPKDAKLVSLPTLVKPLMILQVKPGFKAAQEKLFAASEAIGKALTGGGGLILDDCVEPLVLIYGGQVIRFDGYNEEGGYPDDAPAPSPTPRPERGTGSGRETW